MDLLEIHEKKQYGVNLPDLPIIVVVVLVILVVVTAYMITVQSGDRQ